MADLTPDDRAALARRLGMKPKEIIGATELSADPPAVVVQTHDGQHVLVTEHAVEPWAGSTPTAPPAAPAPPVDDAPPSTPDPDAVPTGTAAEVLAWVGEDKDRATRALQAEQAGQKRAGLTTQLEKLAGLA
jgi:hypothetical protein